MNSAYTQLIKNLEYLKFKQMINHLDEVIDFSTKNNLSFVDALIKLTAYEIDFKEANMIKSMVKVGAFPHKKEVKDFDFSFQPSINKDQILDFLTLRFLNTQENIVFLGPSGVGKTHLATSIGIAAAKRRYSTYFIKCHDLLQQLKRANLENRLDSRLKHFSKYKLLIIDELGYLPINKEDSKLFFQLIDMRYEKKSTILTTNINFNAWDDIFYDPIIANAILDRVLHHAHVVPINGKSYRLKDHFKDDDE
ncbi:IstB (plasmid) [Clostridium botulinum BKT015925]|uniref:IS21-like element ISCbo2 family helper ATPase IstB n=2 Tax=Clostridium botulinum TaxID=1491 RepID=UPI00020754C2|nr:IS21-like element ISCbo2 family helper ATPase IstB [Clostridium botulinum]AEB75563.1 IstB domain protein ATP-binding protein [Clostridium botulinum BKT015925]AEB75621.1 IstB domain protein ATP-binding protein [Clostridium botulinum BKT015925]AEB75700.1 IstB domain protein ATP-binding protein [Clostridium botulinum BKT015925]AEB76077.1 IstB domain protein ATP-binding protein [Clostridium botulinum BKT015925]AEB77463.1 IstB [Clostridium botulinum BKT015925]